MEYSLTTDMVSIQERSSTYNFEGEDIKSIGNSVCLPSSQPECTIPQPGLVSRVQLGISQSKRMIGCSAIKLASRQEFDKKEQWHSHEDFSYAVQEPRRAELASEHSFMYAAQQCREYRNFMDTKHLHHHGCHLGVEADICHLAVGGGNLQVFNRMLQQNKCDWDSLICTYADRDDLNQAIFLFQDLQENSTGSSKSAFVAMLKVCTRLRAMEEGRIVHNEIVKESYEIDLSISCSLMNMYTKCSSVDEAHAIFVELPVQNVVMWTVLITGYTEHGLFEKALSCFDKMRSEDISPNAVTYSCSLQACSSIRNIGKGYQIHAEITGLGFEKHIYVGNTLINMYVKCGSLVEAYHVLLKLPDRDRISWNTVISGYAEHGFGEKVLCCLEKMKLEKAYPDNVTFLCSLKACDDIRVGQVLHIEIIKEGFEEDSSLGSSLVDMYSKCGYLAEAWFVFDEFPVKTVVSWTALIGGYVQHGFGDVALHFYEQLHLEGLSPTAVTSVCGLKACGCIGDIERGLQIHDEIAKKGFEKASNVGTTLVDMYAKCSYFEEARAVFNQLPERDVVSWNVLVGGYAEAGLAVEVMKCLSQMQMEGISPDVVTYFGSLKACSSIRAADWGDEIFSQILKRGFEQDPIMCNTLVDMYAKCGLLVEAQEVFDKLPVQGSVAWNALIAGYTDFGLAEEAIGCLQQMKEDGVFQDAITYAYSLKACACIGARDTGQEVHDKIIRDELKQGSISSDTLENAESGKLSHLQPKIVGILAATAVILGNALIDMYGKCGMMFDAQDVFHTMVVRDLVTWNTLIAGYTQQGESIAVHDTIQRMRREGIQPDVITCLNVLTAYNHEGLVKKGQDYLKSMRRDYGIVPTIDHYNCMIDLFGRAGQLNEAILMLNTMPIEPDLVTWTIVLGACRKWGNVLLAREAFNCAVRLNPKYTPPYSLMINTYADAHMWKEAKGIEKMSVFLGAR